MLEYQGSGNNAFTLEACRLQVFTKQALFFTSPADTRGSLWLLVQGNFGSYLFSWSPARWMCLDSSVSHQVWLGHSLILIPSNWGNVHPVPLSSWKGETRLCAQSSLHRVKRDGSCHHCDSGGVQRPRDAKHLAPRLQGRLAAEQGFSQVSVCIFPLVLAAVGFRTK